MSEWRSLAIKDLGRVVTGATPKAAEYDSWGDEVDFITPSDQRDGARDVRAARKLSGLGADRLSSRLVPAGSACFTCIGATIGKVSLISRPAITNQQINSVVPYGEVADGRFLYYLLRVNARRIAQTASGSATPIVNKRQFGEFAFRVPGLGVQQVIGRLLAALDDKIAVNDRVTATARELMSARYAAAASDGVEVTRIGDIGDVFDGPHATPEKTESGPWFLSISSLQGGRLVLRESAHLSEEDFGRWTRRVTPSAGDVLFSYETRLGEAVLMPEGIRACLGRRMALIRPRGVGSRTLLQAFLSASFQERIRQRTVHGATVDRILLKDFPSWNIDLPSGRPEHLEISLRSLDEVAELRERENEALAELRDTLLPRIISGEIRVRDAEKVVEGVT